MQIGRPNRSALNARIVNFFTQNYQFRRSGLNKMFNLDQLDNSFNLSGSAWGMPYRRRSGFSRAGQKWCRSTHRIIQKTSLCGSALGAGIINFLILRLSGFDNPPKLETASKR